VPGSPLHPRPLSPHLGIYRWQITAVLSALHRITGAALSGALGLVALWLIAAAFWPAGFAVADWILTSVPGKTVLILGLWAFWFHFCNGIRHLAWDSGRGFELGTVSLTGWSAALASFALTAATLALRSLS
jgi:succinate dehydrogenase / fumarate reductase cytochrome b subunit